MASNTSNTNVSNTSSNKKNRRGKKKKGKNDSQVSLELDTNKIDEIDDEKEKPNYILNTNETPTVGVTLIRRVSEEFKNDDTSQPLSMTKSVSARPGIINLDNKAQQITMENLPKAFFGESEYRETMIYLLAFACYNCFPNRELLITSNFEFNLKKRSYYCKFVDWKHNLNNDLIKISSEIDKLTKLNIPIISKYLTHDECIKHFTKTNQTMSVKLCETTNKQYYKVIGCKLNNSEYYILSYRGVLSNLKYCVNYKLFPADINGHFILALPSLGKQMKPNIVPKISKAIQKVYLQGQELSQILQLTCVGDINKLIQSGRTKELVLLSEAFHDMQIVNIAKEIKSKNGIKVILISGPSSSGKTTFASKLAIQLKLLGMNPTGIEVDMYFKDRDDPTHPFDKNGVHNFEVIEAMRIEKLNNDLEELIKGKSIHIPNFSFKDGKLHGLQNKETILGDNGVLILEGIFCLNPKLMETLKKKFGNQIFFRIFMCPIAFYNIDNFHYSSEQVIRLIRRISRDHKHRNKKADNVIFKWGQLQGGEDKNIFPFVEKADAVFNSSLLYELSVLKIFSRPLIHSVKPTSEQYPIAQQLLSFLHGFLTLEPNNIPKTSIIMEFIGKSIYEEM